MRGAQPLHGAGVPGLWLVQCCTSPYTQLKVSVLLPSLCNRQSWSMPWFP